MWIVKVACVVNTKSLFMVWFYHNLIILIKECKIPYKSLDKALLFLRKQIFYLTSSNHPTVQYFQLKLRTRFLPISTKEWVRFVLFCLGLELLAQIKKRLGFYTLVFYTFINNSRSKQNLKNLTYNFVDITK